LAAWALERGSAGARIAKKRNPNQKFQRTARKLAAADLQRSVKWKYETDIETNGTHIPDSLPILVHFSFNRVG